MKKLLIICIACLVALSFAGCATDNAYALGKVVYKAGEIVVEELPLSEDKKAKLSEIDSIATTYDKVRTTVKDSLEPSKKK